MPGCIGGFFWIGCQIDALLSINVLKLILPGAGSILGLYLTGLLVLLGHSSREPNSRPAVANPQSSHA
jgi:hypothetical protein